MVKAQFKIKAKLFRHRMIKAENAQLLQFRNKKMLINNLREKVF